MNERIIEILKDLSTKTELFVIEKDIEILKRKHVLNTIMTLLKIKKIIVQICV